MGKNVYEREKLYEEVWNTPVIKVAESYGVSNVAIKKICKSMKIPTPPNGYWAKLKAGKDVMKKIPLPTNFKQSSIRYGYDPNSKEKIPSFSPLSFLELQEQENIYKLSSTLNVDLDKRLCDELMEYEIFIQGDNSNESVKCSIFINDFNQYSDKFSYSLSKVCGPFSKNGMVRALKILDMLIEGVKHLGYSINSNLTFSIRGESINYNFYEKHTTIDHIITPQEEKDLSIYKKSLRNGVYIPYPALPRHDNIFIGDLLFYAKKNSFIKDSHNEKLEDKLDRILIQLFQQSDILHRARLEKEENERREKEKWRQRNLPAINFNDEVKQLTALLQEIQDFERAEKIRNYITRVQANDINNEKADWIEWAKAKADWYDPIIKRNDSLFGQRRHDAKPIPEEKSISWW